MPGLRPRQPPARPAILGVFLQESRLAHAAITGWGKCLPPAILSNADLTQLFETSDEWILSRTGIRERRISHVSLEELAYVASVRALAAAGLEGSAIDLVVFGTCSNGDQVPNMASAIQLRIGAASAAAMDVNTACTSFLYALSTASALIRTGVVRTALVIGAEVISPFMDWADRNVAVLFGDGAAAVVLEVTQREEGLLAEKLGCYADARETLPERRRCVNRRLSCLRPTGRRCGSSRTCWRRRRRPQRLRRRSRSNRFFVRALAR